MRQLSQSGQQAVNDLAQRHGFSPDAVAAMLDSVLNGNGGMAQFNHFEFGGSGQWMRGGMTMIGDMFNGGLKNRVDALCADLSNLIANQPGLIQTGSFQSQNQGGQQQQSGSGFAGTSSLFVPAQGGGNNWWPGELGWPNSTGAQNNARYAYFAQSRRLAIEVNGAVTVYDTLDHQIGGFSQQQSGSGSLSFTSQYGLVDVGSLPVISGSGGSYAVSPASQASGGQSSGVNAPMPRFPAPDVSSPNTQWSNVAPSNAESDVLATIERLADLRGKGILSDEEFAAKKAELLARL